MDKLIAMIVICGPGAAFCTYVGLEILSYRKWLKRQRRKHETHT